MAGMKFLPTYILLVAVGLLHLIGPAVAAGEDEQFVYSGFTGSNLVLNGAGSVTSSGLLELTNGTLRKKGHPIYPTHLCFQDQQNTTCPGGAVRSFSASFVFGILSGYPDVSANGIAFFVSPTDDFSSAMAAQYLGLLNGSNNGNATNRVFAVELDTMKNSEFRDISDNHVGIDVNSLDSVNSTDAGYYPDGGSGGGFRDLPSATENPGRRPPPAVVAASPTIGGGPSRSLKKGIPDGSNPLPPTLPPSSQPQMRVR